MLEVFDFVSLYDFSFGFCECSDGVRFLVLYFISFEFAFVSIFYLLLCPEPTADEDPDPLKNKEIKK